MKRFSHPAVLPLHAAFVAGNEVWFVTPFMGFGSVRSIMKQHYPLVSVNNIMTAGSYAETSHMHAGGVVVPIMHAQHCQSGVCPASMKTLLDATPGHGRTGDVINKPFQPLLSRAVLCMQGLDEVVIATIMRPVLLGLEYVHKNNGIHRDVKASSPHDRHRGPVAATQAGHLPSINVCLSALSNPHQLGGRRLRRLLTPH